MADRLIARAAWLPFAPTLRHTRPLKVAIPASVGVTQVRDPCTRARPMRARKRSRSVPCARVVRRMPWNGVCDAHPARRMRDVLQNQVRKNGSTPDTSGPSASRDRDLPGPHRADRGRPAGNPARDRGGAEERPPRLRRRAARQHRRADAGHSLLDGRHRAHRADPARPRRRAAAAPGRAARDRAPVLDLRGLSHRGRRCRRRR